MIKAVIFDMFETLITHYESSVYFGTQMAEDAGISLETFLPAWRATETDRTLGNVTLEEVLEDILRVNHRYSEEKVLLIAEKRKKTKQLCFEHLNPEILPMLNILREKEVKIGLISNCYSEEAEVIRESVLFGYFDAVFMSCEQGVRKPDDEIFVRCMKTLEVEPTECLYVGDGGSFELETAKALGMKSIQATWYLKDGVPQPAKINKEFIQALTPISIVYHLYT